MSVSEHVAGAGVPVERVKIGDAEVVKRVATLEAEYAALRNEAAVIDLSAVSFVELVGAGAVDFLQRVVARDVEYLTSERCMTTLVLDDDGSVVDIMTVYGGDDSLLLEPSFGRGSVLRTHLERHADDSVEIVDRSDLRAVGVEGPYAWGAAARIVPPELTSLPFESVTEASFDGVDIRFSRNGLTGEYGYKFIAPLGAIAAITEELRAHAQPIGLEALEIAMLEVRQPSVHLETTGDLSVVEARIAWLLDSTKSEFVGRDAVLAAYDAADRFVTGFVARAEGPQEIVDGMAVGTTDEEVGSVVVSRHSPGLDRTFGLVVLPADLVSAGLQLVAGSVEIETVPSPFILPKSWKTPIL